MDLHPSSMAGLPPLDLTATNPQENIKLTLIYTHKTTTRYHYLTVTKETDVFSLKMEVMTEFQLDLDQFKLVFESPLQGTELTDEKTMGDYRVGEARILVMETTTETAKTQPPSELGDLPALVPSSTLKDSTDSEDSDDEHRLIPGLVGLKNQGATCYLNALMQVLYLTPEFRKLIYSIPCKRDSEPQGNYAQLSDERKQEEVLYQLQLLFAIMQADNVRCTSTEGLTKSFGWDSKAVEVQHDVQELNRLLFDRLEDIIKTRKAGQEDIASLYRGVTTNVIRCSKCGFQSIREEEFYDISVVIKSMRDLYQSLDEFCKSEELSGDNAYLCAQCNSKQTAHKFAKFRTLPPILNIQMIRFEYDFNAEARVKLNDRIQFPPLLHMDAYMLDPPVVPESPPTDTMGHEPTSSAAPAGGPVLSVHATLPEFNGGASLATAPAAPTPAPAMNPVSSHSAVSSGLESLLAAASVVSGTFPSMTRNESAYSDSSHSNPSRTSSAATVLMPPSAAHAQQAMVVEGSGVVLYELFAILVHSGNAAIGHYFAFVKNFMDGRWYKLNDEAVYPVDESDIWNHNWLWAKDTSGRKLDSKQRKPEEWTLMDPTPYMLVYRRRTPRVLAKLEENEEQRRKRYRVAVEPFTHQPLTNDHIPPLAQAVLKMHEEEAAALHDFRIRQHHTANIIIYRCYMFLPQLSLRMDQRATLNDLLREVDKIVSRENFENKQREGRDAYLRFRRVAIRSGETLVRPGLLYAEQDYSRSLYELIKYQPAGFSNNLKFYLEQDDWLFANPEEDAPDHCFLTIRYWDERKCEIRDLLNLSAFRPATIASLIDFLAETVRWNEFQAHQMVVVEMRSEERFEVLADQSKTIEDYDLRFGDILIIEIHPKPFVVDGRLASKVQAYLDDRRSKMMFLCEETNVSLKARLTAPPNPPMLGEYAEQRVSLNITVPQQFTVRAFKDFLSSKCGATPDHLRLRALDPKGIRSGRYLKDPNQRMMHALDFGSPVSPVFSEHLQLTVLPQPEVLSKLHKILEVRAYAEDGSYLTTADVVVNKHWRLSELRACFQAAFGIPPERQVITEWFENRFYKVFSHELLTIATLRIRKGDVLRVDTLASDEPQPTSSAADPVLVLQVVLCTGWNLTREGDKELCYSGPHLTTIRSTALLSDLRKSVLRKLHLAADHEAKMTLCKAAKLPILESQLVTFSTPPDVDSSNSLVVGNPELLMALPDSTPLDWLNLTALEVVVCVLDLPSSVLRALVASISGTSSATSVSLPAVSSAGNTGASSASAPSAPSALISPAGSSGSVRETNLSIK